MLSHYTSIHINLLQTVRSSFRLVVVAVNRGDWSDQTWISHLDCETERYGALQLADKQHWLIHHQYRWLMVRDWISILPAEQNNKSPNRLHSESENWARGDRWGSARGRNWLAVPCGYTLQWLPLWYDANLSLSLSRLASDIEPTEPKYRPHVPGAETHQFWLSTCHSSRMETRDTWISCQPAN